MYNPHLGFKQKPASTQSRGPRGPRKLINAKQKYHDRLINANKNTTWSHLGGDLGGALKCSGSPGLNKCYV